MSSNRNIANTGGKASTPMRPWAPFADVERVFRDFMLSPFGRRGAFGLSDFADLAGKSDVELKETEKHLVFTAALPGINKDDIDIDVTTDSISVSGSKETAEEKPGEKIHIRRQKCSSYSFKYALPADIKPDEVSATYKDGVLEVTMPKAEVTQSTKVEIET